MLFPLRKVSLLCALLLTFALVSLAGADATVSPVVQDQIGSSAADLIVPGQLVVKLTPAARRTLLRQGHVPSLAGLDDQFGVRSIKPLFPQAGSGLARQHGLQNIFLLAVPEATDVWQMAVEYASRSEVVYAEPNLRAFLTDSIQLQPPNDPGARRQWSLHNVGQTGGTRDADIDWPQAAMFWVDHPPVDDPVIAILDTGVDLTHPDLDDRILPGYDFVSDDADPYDTDGHGTGTASIAGAETNNGIGLVGVCLNCDILPVRVGTWVVHFGSVEVAEGIFYAADPAQGNADVISMSLGGTCSDLWADAVNYAYDQNVTMVAAAGNGTFFVVVSPASFERVIAVSATDHNDDHSWWSAYGPEIDVAAPGEAVPVAELGGTYDLMTGTSAATPHVAGTAGLLLGQNPNLSNAEVRQILRDTAEDLGAPGFDVDFGYGRINANAAIQQASNPPAEPYNPGPDNCGILPFGEAALRTAFVSLDNRIEGLQLLQVVQRHRTQIGALLMANPDLSEQLVALVEAARHSSLNGDSGGVDEAFVAQLTAWLQALAARANPGLRAELEHASEALDSAYSE